MRYLYPKDLLKFLLASKFARQVQTENIFSVMNTETQIREQRLAKISQIKQGMMQKLSTGITRLPMEADA